MKENKPKPVPPKFPMEFPIFSDQGHALNFMKNLMRDSIQFTVSYDETHRVHIAYPTGPNTKG